MECGTFGTYLRALESKWVLDGRGDHHETRFKCIYLTGGLDGQNLQYIYVK